MTPTPRQCPCSVFCVRVVLGWLRAFRGEPGAWHDMLDFSRGVIAVHSDE